MKRLLRIMALAFGLVALGFCAACSSTITPKIVSAKQASYDGTEQNSGVLSVSDPKGIVVTAAARDRYNRLVAAYGQRLNPNLRADFGVTALADGTFFVINEAVSDWIVLAAWDNMAKAKEASK